MLNATLTICTHLVRQVVFYDSVPAHVFFLCLHLCVAVSTRFTQCSARVLFLFGSCDPPWSASYCICSPACLLSVISRSSQENSCFGIDHEVRTESETSGVPSSCPHERTCNHLCNVIHSMWSMCRTNCQHTRLPGESGRCRERRVRDAGNMRMSGFGKHEHRMDQ